MKKQRMAPIVGMVVSALLGTFEVGMTFVAFATRPFLEVLVWVANATLMFAISGILTRAASEEDCQL